MTKLIDTLRAEDPEFYADFSDYEITQAHYDADPELSEYSIDEYRSVMGVNAEWGEVLGGIPGRVAGHMQEGVGGLLESVPDANVAAVENMANGTPTILDGLNMAGKAVQYLIDPQAANSIDESVQPLRHVGAELGDIGRVRTAEHTPANQTFGQEIVGSATDSIAQMVLPILGNMVAPGSGAITAPAMFGATSGGAKYSQAREEGNNPGLAARRGVTAGALEGGTEALAAGPLFKQGDTLAKKLVSYLANEVPGENIAEIGDLYADSFLGGKELPTAEQVGDTTLKTTLSTLLAGGGHVGIQKGAEALLNKLPQSKSSQEQKDPNVSQVDPGKNATIQDQEAETLRQAAEAALDLDESISAPEQEIVGPFKPDTPEVKTSLDSFIPENPYQQEQQGNQFTPEMLRQAESLGDIGQEILERAAISELSNEQTQEILSHVSNTIATQQAQDDTIQQQQEGDDSLAGLVRNLALNENTNKDDAGKNKQTDGINDGANKQEQNIGGQGGNAITGINPATVGTGLDETNIDSGRELNNKNSQQNEGTTSEQTEAQSQETPVETKQREGEPRPTLKKENSQNETSKTEPVQTNQTTDTSTNGVVANTRKDESKVPSDTEKEVSFKPTHEDEYGDKYQHLRDDIYLDKEGEEWAFDDGELDAVKDRKEASKKNPITNNAGSNNSQPEGWNQVSNDGLITNDDPVTGGIIDKQIVNGKWFFVANDNSIAGQDGFNSRQEAINALNKAVLDNKNGESNVSNTARKLEPDSQTEDENNQVQAPVQNQGDSDRQDAGQGRGATNKDGANTSERDPVSDNRPATEGEASDQQVPNKEPGLDADVAGNTEHRGRDSTSEGGKSHDDTSAGREPKKVPSKKSSLAEKVKQQKKAEGKKNQQRDIDNIRETLPVLLDPQQDDVLFAEERFKKHHGVLFTNGTGTGKTFTGLGVIKRFVNQGKKNILVVAPNGKVADDWINSGKNLLLDISKLENTQDQGQGITVTLYENFRENTELLKRDYDLLVFDESHKLNQNKAGTQTKAQRQMRLAANLPGTGYNKATVIHREELQALSDKIKTEAKRLSPDKDNIRHEYYEQAKAKYKAQSDKLRKKVDKEAARIAETDRAKVLFLSASPFAYHKSLQYADGLLFDSGQFEDKKNQGGYNVAQGFDAFLQAKLGYKMRYGRLEQPDAEVDTSLGERNLNNELKKSGALRGRKLQVDQDYSREFVLIDDQIGRKIDEGIKFLQDNHKTYPGFSDQLRKRFDYLSRLQLLEAIKAHHAIERINEHIKLGRKVVIFHDYKQGNPGHPFLFNPTTYVGATDIQKFRQARPDLTGLNLSGLGNAIETITSEFSDAMVFNGDVPAKERLKLVKAFNDDKSDKNIIIIQRAAGKEGISLHDTSGKNQRVLIDLGLPIRPTDAIQTEGRIYRTGVVSDAVIEYMQTGLDYEAHAFAQAVAQRSDTAENLAMGHTARNLLNAFVSAYQDANTNEPSLYQGKGGKDGDMDNSEFTQLDQAKLAFHSRQRNNESRQNREGKDYYATPEPVGLAMVNWADLKPNQSALEPSAGHGAIAKWFPDTTDNTFIEPSYSLSGQLGMMGKGTVKEQQFESLNTINKYDAVMMNPPFGSGGSTAVKHLEKAFKHLRDGGRVIAIIPQGPAADKSFNAMYEALEGGYMVADIALPSVTFKKAGTGVRTHVVVIDKVPKKWIENGAQAPNPRNLSYDHIEDLTELFDKLNDLELGPRTEKPKDKDDKEQPRYSKSKAKTNSTTQQVISWLPKRVQEMLGNGLEVVQSVEQLPAHLQERGTALYQAAFHGTPHDFDKFSTGNIGTGEGAQAYGYGLYFAGSKGVAEWYRDKLSVDNYSGGFDVSEAALTDKGKEELLIRTDKKIKDISNDNSDGYWDEYIDKEIEKITKGDYLYNIDDNELSDLLDSDEDISSYFAALRDDAVVDNDELLELIDREYFFHHFSNSKKRIEYVSENVIHNEIQGILSEMAIDDSGENVLFGKGNLYEVELAPKEDEYLLWDKPLSEQSDKVKDIVNKNGLVKTPKGYRIEGDGTYGYDIYDLHLNTYLVGNYDIKEKAQAEVERLLKRRKKEFDDLSISTGIGVYQSLIDNKGSDKAASEYLHSLGIRGIKYLDGSSRSKGDGNYNYVIFNDEDVSITAKYAKGLDGVEGLYDPATKQTYLVADMLTKDNVNQVLNHELLHKRLAEDSKLREQLDSTRAGLRDIFDKIQKDDYKGPYKKLYSEAMERVDAANTPDADRFEEFLAYSVTNFNNKPQSLPDKLKQLIKKLIASVKMALMKYGVPVNKLTPADLNVLAMQAVSQKSDSLDSAGEDAKFSKAGDITRKVTSKIANSRTLNKVLDIANKEDLAFLGRHQLAEFAEDILPAIKHQYLKHARKMSAEKNALQTKTGKIADKWGREARRDKKGAHELADMMNDSTIVGVDPSVKYAPVITEQDAENQIKVIQQKMRDRSGENQAKRMKEVSIIKAKVKFEAKRKLAYPILKRRWDAMPQWAKNTYQEARDYHSQHFKNVLDALEERIAESNATDKAKKALMDNLRVRFESLQANAPYFPLSRFGRYWVSSTLGEDVYFNKFETSKERDAFAKQMDREGYDVNKGQDLDNLNSLDSVSPGFVSDVDNLLSSLGDDPAIDKIRDQVYQMYLDALPDLSVRKHFIHRKKTPGYTRDALRGFSKKAFHDGSQLARLKYGHKLQRSLELIKDSIKAAQNTITYKGFEKEIGGEKTKESRKSYLEEVLQAADNIIDKEGQDRAAAYYGELLKFYEYNMNPNISPVATALNALGFAYFLGGSVAAGIVNTTQTPMVSMPKVAAKFGDVKTIKAFNKAFLQFMKGKKTDDGVVSIETSLKGEELDTFNYFVDLGIIDKTYSHDLAGISNEGIDRGSTSYVVMKSISFFFHHAERFNREITAMAAYRLAREEMTIEQAREYAESIVWHTHFDYASENRPRFMRSNTARVALQFKQYSQGIFYLYGREMHQALKGQSDQVKKEAKGALWRLYAAQIAVTGVTGVFGAGTMEVLTEFFDMLFGDEDDPEDIEAEMRQFIADRVGKTASLAITKGMVDAFTGVSVHGRLGLSDLIFRDSDRELEGRELWQSIMQTAAGPMYSIGENAFVGGNYISEGKYVRGIEKLLPKFAGDAVKAFRYSTEGVKNLKGNKIIDDYKAIEGVFQAIGFSSARVSDRYDQNNAIKGIESKRNNRRSELIERVAEAEDGSAEDNEARKEVAEYNKKVPHQRRIYSGHIARKRANTTRGQKKSVNGITVGRKNKDLLDKFTYSVD